MTDDSEMLSALLHQLHNFQHWLLLCIGYYVEVAFCVEISFMFLLSLFVSVIQYPNIKRVTAIKYGNSRVSVTVTTLKRTKLSLIVGFIFYHN